MRGVGKICAEGWESNGKTEKVAEIVDTQGFAFSVFIPFFIPFFRSVFPF
jgi:membrane protein DedA with SNARE-associated domain